MKQTILSETQSQILENLVVKHGQVVSTRQIYQEVEHLLGYQQTKNLVSKLVKNGWLVRIKREVYSICDLSSRGYLTLSPYVVASILLPESYVSFKSALAYHGMFDQLTQKTISVCLKTYKSFELSGITYRFVKTKPDYFFGWQEVQIESLTARIALPEKSLIDMVNFHKNQSSIDVVIEKLISHKKDLDLNRFIGYLSKYSISTIKSFGLIFDLLGIDSYALQKLIKSKQGVSWMLPGDKKFNAKWRLYYRDYFDKYKTT